MKIFDEIKQYLPKYLSEKATQNLFQNLKDFPDNIQSRLYSGVLDEQVNVFQGDGLRKMLIVKLPNPEIVQGPVMIISNTCDTSFSNKRFISPSLIYCPILKLSNHIQVLKEENVEEEKINARVENIKKQSVSDIFYLPKAGNLPEDCIALFNEINSCDIEYVTPKFVKEKRLFSLSDYGFYLFIFKLSIHFTRIREEVERG